MANHQVILYPDEANIAVPTGTLISEVIRNAGQEISQPCGGQGRCGRCAVIVTEGPVRRRSTIRLSTEDLEAGYALACQSVVEGDLKITIPEQELIARRLTTDKLARKVVAPFDYDPEKLQSVRSRKIHLSPPTLDDSIDDLTRFKRGLAETGYPDVIIPLSVLRQLGDVLRDSEWQPNVLLDTLHGTPRVIEVASAPIEPIGIALDIGTTTVTAYLIDLVSGEVKNSAAEYNEQIKRGEDVISRIIFAGKGDGLQELGSLVRETFKTLLTRIQRRTGIDPENIHKMTVAGNTTMIHLFLRLPPESIRKTPFVPAANQPPQFLAHDLELPIHPEATVDCLPGVASYVGADISAGVLASGLAEDNALTLFIDVGTNGEIVLGNQEWMLTCACSAGPAFEGAGVIDGMRATDGAIEEVWIHSSTYEPTYRVIGDGKPRGICGSGLISLLSELFVTGVIDRGGNVKQDLDSPRVRSGDHGPEYVLVWEKDSETAQDIVLTKVDVENLMRAKAAIFAGFSVLASSVGVALSDVDHVLIGGAFGKYINVENAIKIGLLPDLPWDRFQFLGNTSVLGAYMGLLSKDARGKMNEIADRMTYLELSADNTFFDAFTAALFLPHTDISLFPSVAEIWEQHKDKD